MARLPLLIPFVIGAADGEPVAGKFDGPGSSVWTLDLPGSVVVEEMPASVWVLDDASTPPYIFPIPRFYPQLSGAGSLTAVVAMRIGVQLSGAGELSAVAIAVQPFVVALSGAGTLSASRVARMTRTVDLSGSGTLSASRSLRAVRTAALSGSGTLSATVTAKASVAAQLAGAGTLSAQFENIGGSIPAALGGTGTLSAVVAIRSVRTADLSGVGVLSAARTLRTLVPAALSGAGTLSGAVMLRRFVTADLSGSGVLAAAALKRDAQTVALSGSGTLSATAIARVDAGVANLSGVGTLSATAVAVTFGGASMKKNGQQSLASATWTTLTSFVANDTHPTTVLVGTNGLTIPAGVGVNATAQITYGGSNAANSCRIMVDGVDVATAPSGGQAPTISVWIPAAGVDRVLTLQGFVQGLTGGRVVTSGAGTYATIV